MKSDFKRGAVLFVSTAFGSGYAPVAPGTAGSAVGVFLFLGLSHLPSIWIVLCTVALFFVGVWVSAETEKLVGQKDPPSVVVDEVVGQWISLWWVPLTPVHVGLAFVLFRFFDIIKPFRRVERLPHGWGIMLDDVIAGLFANFTLQTALFVFGNFR
jgi:phosphatidylglycerophosphatase A